MPSVLALVAATAATLAGLVLLVLAYKRRKQARGVLISTGWALIALSMIPWAFYGGVDRGPAMGICVLSLAAIAWIMRAGAISGRGRAAEGDESNPDTRINPDRIPWLRRTWIFLLAGPVALISSAALGVAIFAFTPSADADRLALAAYLVPVIWGGLATWAVSDPRLMRKSIGVVGLGIVGSIAVYVFTATQVA